MNENVIREFLGAWLEGAPEGTALGSYNYRHRKNEPPEVVSAPSDDPGQLADQLARRADRHGLYFYVGLRPPGWESERAGQVDDVSAMVGFGLDIDFSTPARFLNNTAPPDVAAVLEVIDSIELAPWCVVATGGGVQAFWRLDRWREHVDPTDREESVRLAEGVHAWLAEPFRTAGWRVDRTATIERRFRLPGSENRHHGDRREVQIVRFDRTTHPTAAFLGRIAKIPPIARPARSERDLPAAALDTVLNRCAFMRHRSDNAAHDRHGEWIVWLQVLSWFPEGRTYAHQVGSAHPGYSPAETDRLLDRMVKYQHPHSCNKLATVEGGRHCADCPEAEFWTPVFLGLDHGRRQPKNPLVDPQTQDWLEQWRRQAHDVLPGGKAGSTDLLVVEFLHHRALTVGTTQKLPHQVVADRLCIDEHTAGRSMQRLVGHGLLHPHPSEKRRQIRSYDLVLADLCGTHDTLKPGGTSQVSRVAPTRTVLAGSRWHWFLEPLRSGEAMSISEIAGYWKKSVGPFYRMLPALLDIGAVVKVRHGRYRRSAMTDLEVAVEFGLIDERDRRFKQTFVRNLDRKIAEAEALLRDTGKVPWYLADGIEGRISRGVRENHLVVRGETVVDLETGVEYRKYPRDLWS